MWTMVPKHLGAALHYATRICKPEGEIAGIPSLNKWRHTSAGSSHNSRSTSSRGQAEKPQIRSNLLRRAYWSGRYSAVWDSKLSISSTSPGRASSYDGGRENVGYRVTEQERPKMELGDAP